MKWCLLKEEFVFPSTVEFPSCHASTLAETQDHKLVVAWFGGTAESASDVKIYASIGGIGGWSTPKAIADGIRKGKHFACYNPVLFQYPDGPLMLFYKFGTGPQNWWGSMASSADGGKSWQTPSDLPPPFLGPIKNKPILLPNGSLLCPSSNEVGGWTVHFEQTYDFGKTWTTTSAVTDINEVAAIQPAILTIGARHLKAIARTKQGKLLAIDSFDGGNSWNKGKFLDLPNPNSGIDAVTLRDGRHILVYNDSKSERSPLVAAISSDGELWTKLVTLESGPGEFSYPAVIQTQDGLIHITYTWKRRRIKHAVLELK